jgi:hypothetical protein
LSRNREGLNNCDLVRGKSLTGERLAWLRNLVFLAEQVNEEVYSRENYRIHNGAMSNYDARMRIYDESLVRGLRALEEEITAYEKVDGKK